MASQPTTTTQHNDSTFRAYSSAQAQEYADRRGGYPEALITEIINLHKSTGGQFTSLLDLGCGPGTATRALAPHFSHATGLDPSAEMISAAKTTGGHAKDAPIAFLQGEAEACESVPDASVDLITAATAAHWFDMRAFWPTAARVLRPGATVALFTIWRTWCHPMHIPCASEVHAELVALEQGAQTLGPWQKGGNWSLMGLYHDLRMPWELAPPCKGFDEAGFRRQVWNEEGVPAGDGTFLCGERWVSVEEFERSIGTISAATRWREAHPRLVGTEDDVVKAAFGRIGALLEREGLERLCMVGPTVVVSLKRS